ncbi:MAG TPA: CAP domain-containing protein, partial [Candidatus Limnocylindrales bacterium]|nr:CAP domain-containing protein [Candidatus Limnocylindrales bacterium]
DAYGIPTGATGAVNGTWLAVEQYYLRLMNCTRTGGWVTSTGACSSPGGLSTAPLRLNATISSRVSRPYARLLATSGQCDHFIGGNPGDRLRAAGFTGYNWGENIGCRDGNPYSSVLGTHLFYQGEKSYNGGHYRNLMNPGFRQVGIGVWVGGGHTRLVIDFYGG